MTNISVEKVVASDSEESASRLGLKHRLLNGTTTWTFVFLVVLLALFSMRSPGAFSNVDNFRNIGLDTSILLILAVGSCFVILTAGIDLSVGAVLVFAGIVSAKTMERTGDGFGSIVLGLVVALAAGFVWGLINGALVAFARIPAFIATLGTYGAATGLGLVITDGLDVRTVPPGLVENLGNGAIGGIPYLIIISALIVGVSALILHATVFGRYTLAIGSNEESARRVGVKVEWHLVKVYALAGLLAGFAGYLSLARFATTTISGHATDNFQAITAVVLGGTSLFGGVGTIFGTVIGAFIPTVLNNGLVILGVQPFWQQVAVGVILVTAVYFDQWRRSKYRN